LSIVTRPLLDTALQVDTPEGCQIELRLAGPVARARAWLLDLLFRTVIYILAGQLLAWFGKMGFGVFLILLFALEWLYPVVFEVLWQATPGKRILKLAVVHEDGRPLGWNASFIRNTLRFMDFFPFFYGIGLASILLTRHGQRLGDLAAGTVVIYREPRPAPAPLAQDITPEAPAIALTADEQRAVIEYGLRAPRLNDERAIELAEYAQPLCRGITGVAARERLLRISHFLRGGA
jgi:uncharacterized RDD family membrane protein YckC